MTSSEIYCQACSNMFSDTASQWQGESHSLGWTQADRGTYRQAPTDRLTGAPTDRGTYRQADRGSYRQGQLQTA